MKHLRTFLLSLIAVAMMVGCVSPRKGPAYGHEQEFRQRLSESVPVREHGYTIKDLRFTEDYQKASVLFGNADKSKPEWEFILTQDGFGRYRGTSIQPFYTPGTANTPPVQITVTVPNK